MTTEITYIAYDGTRFDNGRECRDYETKTKWQPFTGMIKFFDKDGKPLPLGGAGFANGAITYIVCKNKEAAQFIYEEFEGIYILPWKNYKEADAGCWYWDGGRAWRLAQELFDKADFVMKLIKDEPI